MKLEVWKADWGLPSVDVECLQIMALIKFTKAPVEFSPTNNPFWSQRGVLPILRDENLTIYDFDSMKKHLENKGFNADARLSNQDAANVYAFVTLMKQKLVPALKYIWWLDERNYTEVTRKWYAKALPFPLNYFYPGHYERKARISVLSLYNEDTPNHIIESAMYTEAQKCIVALSNRLGESLYFFGNEPCSLDAIVYGHLAPLLKAPFPSSSLKNHLNACSNLVKFITRITCKYFPDCSDTQPKPSTKFTSSSSSSSTKMGEDDFPNATRNKILASFVAMFAMFGYALLHGMIPTNELDNEVEFEEIYDEENES